MTVPAGMFAPPGGQPTTHPTVGDAGMPPAPASQPVASTPVSTVPSAPATPHPTVPQGQPGTAPAPATTVTAPGGVDLNQVIQAGPGVPPELVGRTIGQSLQIYSALAGDWLKRNSTGQPAPTGAPATPAAPAAPATPSGDPNKDFWLKPVENIQRIVSETVKQQMAPVTANAQEAEIIRARDIARAGIPDINELWPEIVTQLSSADPAALTNPAVWEAAADLARGRKARAGRTTPVADPYAAAGGRPSVPVSGNPVLPQVAFFTEGSSPPTTASGSSTLSPDEAAVASKMGMSPQDYMAWRGGARVGR